MATATTASKPRKNSLEHTVKVVVPGHLKSLKCHVVSADPKFTRIQFHKPHSKDRYSERVIATDSVALITTVGGESEIHFKDSGELAKREGALEIDKSTGFFHVTDIDKRTGSQRVTLVNPAYAQPIATDIDAPAGAVPAKRKGKKPDATPVKKAASK